MGQADEWWRSFFTGPMVEWWLGATTDEQTKQEADFIQETLHVAPPAKLLDVPCGGGRHSIELARRGFPMTGVDISSDFLTAARVGAAQQSVHVHWEQREMRDLPWNGAFDGAYCFGNSFGYLEEGDNAAFIKSVARTLKPGARFVLEVSYIAEVLFPSLQERAWYPNGNTIVLADRRYDPVTGRLHVEYTCIEDGKQDKHAMSARIHSCREVKLFFEAAGLSDVQGFGSFAKEPFKLRAERLLMVGTK